MNYAIPVLVCHQNEDFRGHLREMLTKHGFFHVIEAMSNEEMSTFLSQEKNYFAIIDSAMATRETIQKLRSGKNGFLFLAQPNEAQTIELAVQMGVKSLLSFPFTSQQLAEKITAHQ